MARTKKMSLDEMLARKAELEQAIQIIKDKETRTEALKNELKNLWKQCIDKAAEILSIDSEFVPPWRQKTTVRSQTTVSSKRKPRLDFTVSGLIKQYPGIEEKELVMKVLQNPNFKDETEASIKAVLNKKWKWNKEEKQFERS